MSAEELQQNEEGFALAAALIFLVLISAILLSFTLVAKSTFERTTAIVSHDIGNRTLRNIIDLTAQVQLLIMKENLFWPTPQLVCRIPMGNGGSQDEIKVQLINHAGLIDLNSSRKELLTLGFQSIGLAKDEAEEISRSVLNYRTPKSAGVHNDSVFSQDYRPHGGWKGGLIEAVAELTDFPILSSVSAERLNEVFTVFSRSGTLDMKFATQTLENSIKSLGVENARFITRNGKRFPAISIRIAVGKNGNFSRWGIGTIGMNLAEGEVVHLLPVRITYEDIPASEVSDADFCLNIWSEHNIEIARKLIN